MSRYLEELPIRLAQAVSAAELELATQPPDDAGVRRSLQAGQLRLDTRLVPDHVPRAALRLDPPAGARELCEAWGVARPVAVAVDVHQRMWSILVAADELPDPYGTRIASHPIRAGRWELVPWLTGRPEGQLPSVVSGASPAYDVREYGGSVVLIEIRPADRDIRTLEPGHPHARELLGAMASAYPAWRGGWKADPAATFVMAGHAGAALSDAGDGVALACELCIVGDGSGVALLDALEAVARERGFARLRLDSSAFLYGDELPYARCGYAVGPPYDGDADVDVWAEKDLAVAAGRMS